MKKHIVAVAVSSCLSTMVMADEPDLNNVSADQGVVLDNIVVSGEKQRRSLKDTTSSVSVINAENLDQYQNLHDAISAVPNLVVQTGVVPNVRGITGNGAAGGFNSISGGANARFTTLVDGVVQPVCR